MHDVCFGFLDNTQEINHPFVIEKARQLTNLSVTRHFQAPHRHEADNVMDLLRWFKKQHDYEYMVVMQYGVILDDLKIVRDAIEDFQKTNSLVKGKLVERDGFWYFDERFLVFAKTVPISNPYMWGGAGERRILTTGKLQHSDDECTSSLVRDNTQRPFKTTTKGSGWGVIENCLMVNRPVLNFSPLDELCLEHLEPELNTEALAEVLSDWPPFTPNLTTLSHEQASFINYHAVSPLRHSAEVFDTEVYRPVSGETQIEIRNLYCLASGFRPLQILKHHGFRDDTVVTYFDYNEVALVTRRITVQNWDGIDYPSFLKRLKNDYGMQLLWPCDVERAWEGVLKTFGGPREFKVLWDRYSKLQHHYRRCDLCTNPEMNTVNIVNDPKSYLWFSDAFASTEANIYYSPIYLEYSFLEFLTLLRKKNPKMILDGRWPNGRWF